MFNFNEFATMIANCIIDVLPEDFADANVEIREVTKNNDTKLTGLVVTKKGSNIAPNVYLESFYLEYQSGKDYEDVLEHIAEVVVKHSPKIQFDVSNLTDLDKVRNRIIPRLINAKRNEEYLTDKPHRLVEDLAVVYAVNISEDETGTMSAPVTYSLIESYGITPEELDNIAMYNLEEMSVSFKSMRETLIEMYKESHGDEDIPEYMLPPEGTIPDMYVLTNVSKLHGAAMILNKGIMDSVLDRVGRDVVIIPSSVHEVLVLPVPEDSTDTSEYANMIQDVNRSSLESNEILSDHAYLYTRKDGLMSI